MTMYRATLRTQTAFTIEDIDAETPEQALRQARALADNDPLALDWESYDDFAPVEEIEIDGKDGCEAVWHSEDRALRLAAPEMLEALEFVRMTFADMEASKRKGYDIECPKVVAAAIAKATDGE